MKWICAFPIESPSYFEIVFMKTIFLLLLPALLTVKGFTQNLINPYPKTITVTGSAEMEIIPDEIYVHVTLREYEKKGSGKVDLETIKQQFLQNAKAVGIADSLISIAAYDGFNGNPWLRKKGKKEELLAAITYQLKVKGSRQMDNLVERLDDAATQNFAIDRTSHSRIADYRKQLKIAAVKAAKEKAEYLAEAIGEKLGVAVTVNEPTEYFTPVYMRTSNAMMKSDAIQTDGDVAQPDFKKLKLKYDVTVVFALK